MKLPNLLIIFIVIALPVILILTLYIGYQVDTINLKSLFDNRLIGSTYDSLEAFEINTTNNQYSTVSDSLIRDIEASIKTFSTSFSSAIRKTGSTKGDVMSYVPALVYTMYDGYYIYTPVTSAVGDEDDIEISLEHRLKPYVYYTKEYSYGTNNKIVINYSLDNYVVVYDYHNNASKSFTSKAGYLELKATTSGDNEKGIYCADNDGDGVYDIVKYNGKTIEKGEKIIKSLNGETEQELIDTPLRDSAWDYYVQAYDFTKWYNQIINNTLNSTLTSTLCIEGGNSPLPYDSSKFNNEKEEVIKDSITKNLIQSMEMYRKRTNIEFQMPKFNYDDWDKILHNVCMISFMQGFPIGTSTYNNYVIVPSTENKQFVDETNIYYIGYGTSSDGKNSDRCYHRIGCQHLNGDTIVRI